MSFFLVFLATVALGATTYIFAQKNNRLVAGAISQDFNGSIIISQLAVDAQQIRRYEKEYFMYIGNAKKKIKYQNEWSEIYHKLKEQLGTMLQDKGGIWTEADKQKFQSWQTSLEAYGRGFNKVIEDVNNGVINDTLTANKAVQEAKNAFRVMVNGTIEEFHAKYQHALNAETQIKASNTFLIWVLLGGVGGSVILCLILLSVVPRSITRPITLLSEAAETMSKGQLNTTVPTKLRVTDFLGLANTLERMRISQKVLLERAARGPQDKPVSA